MGLPSPQQLNELSGLVEKQGQFCHGKWPKFKGMVETLLLTLMPTGAQTGTTQAVTAMGVSSGLPVGVTTGGVFIGTTVAPIGAALAPWIGAATVAMQAGKIFDLYDLKEDAEKGGSAAVNYTCGCGNCAANIQYIIDKKERNAALVAVGVATLGVSAIGKAFHSIGKSLHSSITGEVRPKERTCRAIVESARGGCTAAMGTIFLLSGSWTFMSNPDKQTMATAVAIITSEDGWEKLKASF